MSQHRTYLSISSDLRPLNTAEGRPVSDSWKFIFIDKSSSVSEARLEKASAGMPVILLWDKSSFLSWVNLLRSGTCVSLLCASSNCFHLVELNAAVTWNPVRPLLSQSITSPKQLQIRHGLVFTNKNLQSWKIILKIWVLMNSIVDRPHFVIGMLQCLW